MTRKQHAARATECALAKWYGWLSEPEQRGAIARLAEEERYHASRIQRIEDTTRVSPRQVARV